jgi:hypothetical protein
LDILASLFELPALAATHPSRFVGEGQFLIAA